MFFQMFILHGSPLQTALVQTLRTLNSNGLRIKPWVLGALGTAKMWFVLLQGTLELKSETL